MDANKLQRGQVLAVMADGNWRTLPELSRALGNRFLITSISARLRDFRKTEFGGYRVERRLAHENLSERLFEYRLLPPLPVKVGQAELFEAVR